MKKNISIYMRNMQDKQKNILDMKGYQRYGEGYLHTIVYN